MKKTLSVIYGVTGYLVFLAVFNYFVAFAMNLAPHSVSGEVSASPWFAALVNVLLITLFGLQHSIMARPGFKQIWTRLVPHHLERSTFVWIASGMVALIVLGWQPIAGDLWNVQGAGAIALYGISALGWMMVPVCSFLTDHFELFGLRQVYDYAKDRCSVPDHFKQRALYKKVRHPMMLGFVVAMWAAPHMTVGHLVFAGTMTLYILVGIFFEERDLVKKHGASYRRYQQEVPKLLPFGAKQSGSAPVFEATEVRS